MLGLSSFWITSYFIACAVYGKVPSVTEGDPPSRLFSLGGVLSMQRPVVEVVWRTTCAGLCGIGALAVCDVLYARHTKARYFALHVIANTWITCLCVPDCYYLLTDPVNALSKSSTPNHWPTALVFSIHLYHMLFFSGLQWIDWLHHILMVIVGAPLLITGEIGPLMNFNHFFMCGVPGGVDYLMLFCVKHGWMSPLTEKRYNAAINVWVREPALMCTATFGYMQLHLQPEQVGSLSLVRVCLIGLACWNGLFFMERVVGNYHVCAYKARKASQAARESEGDAAAPRTAAAAAAQKELLPPRAKASPGVVAGRAGGAFERPSAAADDDDAYETEEHISIGLPGLGMRTSVSKQDLTEINSLMTTEAAAANGSKPAAQRAREEAYPAGVAGKVKLG